jgi:mannose-6-phosphate isomerase-like protein (cupin superfamily)
MTDSNSALANWDRHVARSAPFTPAQMAERVARFKDLPASPKAFADTYIPGHERVLYSVIGSPQGNSVHEDPAFESAIPHALNFVVDYIEAPPGCGAALHYHDSEEVFVAISGRWEVSWGDEGEHRVILEERDVISVPPFVMRAFKNLGSTSNYLLSILGGQSPGKVKWARKVAEEAKASGIGFNEDGNAVLCR